MSTHPVLSALVPTRERSASLKFSLDSLKLGKNNIEALVWIDDDDPQLGQYHNLFGGNNHIKMFVKPKVGYMKFYIMMNFLAENATGDWLWLWNDDAYMRRLDWFEVFSSHASRIKPREEPLVFNLSPGKNGFPVVSRKYFNILGHFGRSATCDLWTRRVVEDTNIHVHIPGIEPVHRKYDNDKKLGNLIDNTYRSVEALRAKSRYFGGRAPSVIEAQRRDAAKIVNWLKQHKSSEASK